MKAYAGLYSSFEINSSLRTGIDLPNYAPNLHKQAIKNLTQEIADSKTLTKPIKVYRGVSVDFANKLNVGDTFIDDGFTSTSTSRDIVENHRIKDDSGKRFKIIVMEIHLPRGAKALEVESSGEKELIVQRSSKFHVDGKSDAGIILSLILAKNT